MAASSRTRSGPNVSFERGHRDRLIAPTMKKVSPGLSPTAAAIIHKAQAGRFSIAHVPPLHRREGWRGDSQQPVNPCPISETTTNRQLLVECIEGLAEIEEAVQRNARRRDTS